MLTEAQLAARKSGLGGSDTATILNLNPYKSAYELWQEKSGRVEPEDISGKFAIRRGNDMEALVIKWFEEESGLQVETTETTLTNPDHPFMLGHIDGKIVGVPEGMEAKTANWRMAAKFGDDGTDDVPASYLIQCMHYMIVTGWRVWHLAADVGGDFRIYRIEYDETLANHIATTVHDWWTNHIVNDIEPEPTGRAIDIAYPSADPDDCVEASGDIADVHTELKLVHTELKALKEKDAGLRDQIKAAMGTAAAMTYGGAKLATWGNQNRSSFNTKQFKEDHPALAEEYTKQSSFRVFRPNLR